MYDRCRELRHLSLHYSHVCCLLDYTSDTLRCMHEAWEDILLTVDAKLAQYSKVGQKIYLSVQSINFSDPHKEVHAVIFFNVHAANCNSSL